MIKKFNEYIKEDVDDIQIQDDIQSQDDYVQSEEDLLQNLFDAMSELKDNGMSMEDLEIHITEFLEDLKNSEETEE